MSVILPKRLGKGSHVRVIAPSQALVKSDDLKHAQAAWEKAGFKISFGKHAHENRAVAARLEDLHDAFADKRVDAIVAGTGGAYSLELINGLDKALIRKNPKVVMGYSDTTSLLNAITQQTGLVTFYGPLFMALHWAQKHLPYTLDAMKQTLCTPKAWMYKPSTHWKDCYDYWTQPERVNIGPVALNPGTAEGVLVGGHTANVLKLAACGQLGNLAGKILFLETIKHMDAISQDMTTCTLFETLWVLAQQPGADKVQGLMFGRMQDRSWVSMDSLRDYLNMLPAFRNKPAVGNMDFGHTFPIITLPIGGTVQLKVQKNGASLKVAAAVV